MKTTPATLDGLFASDQSSVTLQLLEQAALALGRKLKDKRPDNREHGLIWAAIRENMGRHII